jgi:DNA-binding MarR family transcriptional regulator
MALRYPDVMADSEQSIPIGMMASRLLRATQLDCLARLNRAGYTDLRMRHLALFEGLPREGARVTTLAAQTGMTKQAMGELIDEIEAGGYIERRGDPADRRARIIEFTAKGQRAYEQALTILGEMERDYAALVGTDRYAEVRTTLEKLTGALEETNR